MKVFTICNSLKDDNKEVDLSRNILVSILREQRDVESKWGTVFSTLSEEITRTITEDINFAPFQLKVGLHFFLKVLQFLVNVLYMFPLKVN